MAKLHSLESVDLSFFDNAPYRISHTLEINCSVERMMQALRDDKVWMAWAGPMKSADWTSQAGGKNSTREVYLKGGVLLKEIFFHWEEGNVADEIPNRGVAFAVTHSSAPGLKKFAENHSITPVSTKQGKEITRLKVTVGIEPTTGGKVIAPLIYFALKIMLPKVTKKYQVILEA